MAKQSPSEQLDNVVSRLLGRPDAPLPPEQATRDFDASFSPIIEVIAALRDLPRPDFKARLKSDLERRAAMASTAQAVTQPRVTATPYLSVRGASAAIEFYKKAFGATELYRLMQPDGRVGHAEIDINGAKIMLADEFPEMGFKSPESLGGSPVNIHLDVPDVDAFARRAVQAGATVVRPVSDQFYGARSGHVRDPFGYTWQISTPKESVSPEEMQRRIDAMSSELGAETEARTQQPQAVNYIREGFHTVTPYLILSGAARWIEFAKQAFGAQEKFRAQRPPSAGEKGSDTIMHAELQIGDSMIELADANPQFPAMPTTLLLRVDDPDLVFHDAIAAGATEIEPVSDKEFGSRGGTVLDPSGNRLSISRPLPGSKIFDEFRSVTPHLNPAHAAPVIEFLERAFDGEEIYRTQPEERILYAQVRVGDSILSMSEAHGPYQPMPTTLHLYVPDTDALYEQALRAGAESIQPPADQPYGDRGAGVRDPFGNRWFIATHMRDVAF
jgi:PhnB protein